MIRRLIFVCDSWYVMHSVYRVPSCSIGMGSTNYWHCYVRHRRSFSAQLKFYIHYAYFYLFTFEPVSLILISIPKCILILLRETQEKFQYSVYIYICKLHFLLLSVYISLSKPFILLSVFRLVNISMILMYHVWFLCTMFKRSPLVQ